MTDIPITTINDKKVISATDFYQAIQLHPAHFQRWLSVNVTDNPAALPHIDYFVVKEKSKNHKDPTVKIVYYFSLWFCSELCCHVRSEEAVRVKRELVGYRLREF